MKLTEKSKGPVNKLNLFRSTEKQRLDKEHGQNFKKFLSKFSKSKYKRENVGHKEYLYFLTLLQMPLHYIVFLFDLVLRYGAALVLGVYLFFVIHIGLPIFMLFIFMGSYCRKGYIKYWQCIPLLKGAGYTIALMTLTPEFINTTSAGLSVLYVTDMFSVKLPWIDCKFERVTDTCIPMNVTAPDEPIQCANATFSALDYFRFNKENRYKEERYDKLGPVKKDWFVTVTITWILVFIFMVRGFQNFQKIMRLLQLFAVICWLIVFVASVCIRGRYHQKSALYYGLSPAFNTEFWINIFMHVCDRDEPGSVILLSSLGITMAAPNIDALVIYSIKMVWFALLIIWVPILLQNVFGHYNISETGCKDLNGYEIIFAVIPDVLSRLHIPQFWILLWFFCIYIHSFASVLYTFTGAVEALTEAFPKLIIYRIHICALMCMMSIGINSLFVTRLGRILLISWSHYGMAVLRMVVMAIVTFAITFIYSIPRLVTDYHFAYGEPPTKFWIQLWKIAPFLVLFETVFLLYHHTYEMKPKDTTATLVLLSYTAAGMMLSPIFIVMLWKYCQHIKYRMVSSLIRPEDAWGYYNVAKRTQRNRFNPQKEVRYKSDKIKCKHLCLLRSRRLRKLHRSLVVKRNLVYAEMIKKD